METEKRNLQIDLETARYIYKMNKPVDPEKTSIYGNIFLGIIKGAFTVEELEGIEVKSFRKLPPQNKTIEDYAFQQSMGFRTDQERQSTVFKPEHNPPPFSLEQAQQTYKDLQAYPKCQSLIN